MKQLISGIILIIIALPLMAGTITGRPMMFADSYMMRAHGSEANYWNPALLSDQNIDFWWPLMDMGIYASNNTFDLEFYNRIMKQAQITPSDKAKLLRDMDGSLRLNLASQASIIGLNVGGAALSSSIHSYNTVSLSENYLKLLLYGNDQEEYRFTKKHYNLSSLSYVDLTVGMGDVTLPLPQSVPPIKFGFSGSLLFGIEETKTTEFDGFLRSDFDDFHLKQDVTQRIGLGGIGFKGMLGFASEPVKNLKVGLTLDNILGNIRWGLSREDFHYMVSAENVYVADLDEEFFNTAEERSKADAFGTKLPMELRMGALFDAQKLSFSADYRQGFGESVVTSTVPTFSFGAELNQIDSLPLKIGFSTGNTLAPWRVSYGLGLRAKPIELGIGLQSFQSLLPGKNSKGIAFALSFRTGI